jgi:hypothetical protein
MVPCLSHVRPPPPCLPWSFNSPHVVLEMKREQYNGTITPCYNGPVRRHLVAQAACGVGAMTQGRAAARCACSIAAVCSRRCTHWAASEVAVQGWLRREVQGQCQRTRARQRGRVKNYGPYKWEENIISGRWNRSRLICYNKGNRSPVSQAQLSIV